MRKIILTITQRSNYGYQVTLDRGDGAPIPVTGWLADPKEVLLCIAGYTSADKEATLEIKTDESFDGHLETYYRMGRSAGEFQCKNATAPVPAR